MGLLDFLKPRHKTTSVHEAYLSIVKQARRPEFYAPAARRIVLTGAST